MARASDLRQIVRLSRNVVRHSNAGECREARAAYTEFLRAYEKAGVTESRKRMNLRDRVERSAMTCGMSMRQWGLSKYYRP